MIKFSILIILIKLIFANNSYIFIITSPSPPNLLLYQNVSISPSLNYFHSFSSCISPLQLFIDLLPLNKCLILIRSPLKVSHKLLKTPPLLFSISTIFPWWRNSPASSWVSKCLSPILRKATSWTRANQSTITLSRDSFS